MNVLFVTLDEFRADCLSVGGHPLVETPALDRLAAEGVRFASHFSQAAPCAPGRASLYTGMYQMNHRVVANGAPLEDRFDNVARLARRAGYAPALFGYTDQGVDPATVADPSDPSLDTYEGVLPGFDAVLPLDGRFLGWLAWLEDLGYGTMTAPDALRSEPDRPAEHSASAFLTEGLLGWIDRQDGPWFAHASYFRPHFPYAAAGEYATRYAPDDVGDPLPPLPGLHPLIDMALGIELVRSPADRHDLARLRAQYFGMVSEVDHQLGRVVDHLRATGGSTTPWWWSPPTTASSSATTGWCGSSGSSRRATGSRASSGPPGPAGPPAGWSTRSPRASTCSRPWPSCWARTCPCSATAGPWCRSWTAPPPTGGARRPTTSGTGGTWSWARPARRAAPTPALERSTSPSSGAGTHAYVQFADGSWLCFDLAADPTWATTTADPAVVLPLAQSMLTWRSTHLGGEPTPSCSSAPTARGLWPEHAPA